jgi:hypothetical protein
MLMPASSTRLKQIDPDFGKCGIGRLVPAAVVARLDVAGSSYRLFLGENRSDVRVLVHEVEPA